MNYLALLQRLHSETLRTTAAPTVVTGGSERNQRLANAIGDAWAEVQSERDWKWMRVTTDAPLTAGLQTYAAATLGIGSRFGRWRHEDETYCPMMYLAGSPNTIWSLTQWDLDNFRHLYIYRTQGNSTPVAFAIDETQQFLVGPAPSDAYMLRAEYWMEPSTLVEATDSPDMPARFHMLLVWRALMSIARSDAAPELLNRAEFEYGNLHDKLLFDQGRLPTT
jgi:hypothetical protein